MRQLEADLYTDLTERQEQVLEYIYDCIRDGMPPTRAEIARHFGFKSANAAQEVVARLVEKGRITILHDIPRGIRIAQA
jgi:repressor LexA